MNQDFDVLVVGAGPVGLLSAIELTLAGANVLVLERLTAPSMVVKALGMGPLGIETLQRRGMASALAVHERTGTMMRRPQGSTQGPAGGGLGDRGSGPRISGHFGGLTLIRVDAQREPGRLGRPLHQQAAEAMLAERAAVLGIEVRRGCEVTALLQQPDGVAVEWSSPTGGGRARGGYVVGCDGGRSTIRKMAGFAFPGTPATMSMYHAVVELDHPDRLGPAGFRYTAGGMYIHGILPDRVALLDFSAPPADRQAPVTREEFEAVLRRVSGQDLRVRSMRDGSRWADNTRLVDTYRQGRVLLAGDAAHIHSPFGGQGMSLGLVDAANLGWKLAAVVRGEMPDALLDTYTAERRPAAEAVLDNTRAQAAIMRPDPQSAAMRNLMANLLQLDDVNRLIGGMISGLSTRYDLGSNQDDVGRLIGNRPVRQEKDADGSLYDLMQDGRAVFLDASAEGAGPKLIAAATPRVRCVTVATGPSMLIRPDACVAWTSEDDGIDGLDSALCRWFRCATPLTV